MKDKYPMPMAQNCCSAMDGDEAVTKYSGKQYNIGHKGNDKGRVEPTDDYGWSEADVQETGLITREKL